MDTYKITFFNSEKMFFDTEAGRIDVLYKDAVGRREAIILAQAEQVKAGKPYNQFKAELINKRKE